MGIYINNHTNITLGELNLSPSATIAVEKYIRNRIMTNSFFRLLYINERNRKAFFDRYHEIDAMDFAKQVNIDTLGSMTSEYTLNEILNTFRLHDINII